MSRGAGKTRSPGSEGAAARQRAAATRPMLQWPRIQAASSAAAACSKARLVTA